MAFSAEAHASKRISVCIFPSFFVCVTVSSVLFFFVVRAPNYSLQGGDLNQSNLAGTGPLHVASYHGELLLVVNAGSETIHFVFLFFLLSLSFHTFFSVGSKTL